MGSQGLDSGGDLSVSGLTLKISQIILIPLQSTFPSMTLYDLWLVSTLDADLEFAHEESTEAEDDHEVEHTQILVSVDLNPLPHGYGKTVNILSDN